MDANPYHGWNYFHICQRRSDDSTGRILIGLDPNAVHAGKYAELPMFLLLQFVELSELSGTLIANN